MSKEIHSKPIVTSELGDCELGDLFVVVKYYIKPETFEAKSIIYQAKLARGNTRSCSIDQNQLRLLCDWPKFPFGKKSQGGSKEYFIEPKTLEFGSYMLELRNPRHGNYLSEKYRYYGNCPNAMLVREYGPENVHLDQLRYTRGDAQQFFSHLAFEIGEHHSNEPVKELVDSLYRYIELSPDPPGEFDGYSIEKRDDGFAVLEIIIKPEKPE